MLHKIVALASLEDPEKESQLAEQIRSTAAWLHIDLHFEDRPSIVEKRDALEDLSEKLVSVANAYENLDVDSKAALEKAATDTSQGFPLDALAVHPASDHGAISPFESMKAIDLLWHWTSKALASIGKPKRGAPRKEAMYRAVAELAKAWAEAKGTPATRSYDWLTADKEVGPFGAFARKALQPLNVEVSDDAVKQAISAGKN